MSLARVALHTVALVGLFLVGVGCAKGSEGLWYPHYRQQTMTQSPGDHASYISDIAEHDRRALADDLDLFFMTDRPTRLTRWQTR